MSLGLSGPTGGAVASSAANAAFNASLLGSRATQTSQAERIARASAEFNRVGSLLGQLGPKGGGGNLGGGGGSGGGHFGQGGPNALGNFMGISMYGISPDSIRLENEGGIRYATDRDVRIGNIIRQRQFQIMDEIFKRTNIPEPARLDFTPIQDLLNQARLMRGAIFNPSVGRPGEVNFALSNAGDLARGFNSQTLRALQSRGLAGIQTNFLNQLRNLRSVAADRSLPSSFAAGQRADLLKERLRNQKDLEQGLILADVDQRFRGTELFNQILGGAVERDIAIRTQRLGKPELDALSKLQMVLEQARLDNARNIAQGQTRAALTGARINAGATTDAAQIGANAQITSALIGKLL